MFHRTQNKIIIVMSAIALLMMAGLYLVKKSDQAKIVLLLSNQQSDQKVLLDKIIELKSKSVKNFADDYSYWDEMVAFVKSGNLTWAEENIVTSMPTFGIDISWVYRPDLSVMYSSNRIGADHLNQLPLSTDVLGKIAAKGPLSHFFLLTDSGLLEIFGASIHPTADAERKTPPQGFFFVGCLWTETYLKEISRLSATDISLASTGEAQSEAEKENIENFIIVSTKALNGWDGTHIINVVATSKALIAKTLKEQLDVQYLRSIVYSFVLLALLFFILFQLVNRPLYLLSKSLSNGNPDIIKGLTAQQNEFGNMAVMITEFFSQKNLLVQEIAVRKQAERSIQEEQNFSVTILNSLPGIFYLFDMQGKFLRWNRNFEIVSGYSYKELMERHASDFFAGAEKELVRQRIQETFVHGQANVEAHFISKNGVGVPYFLTGVRIKIDDQSHLLGIGIDITERKRAEEALEHEHSLLRTLIDHIPDSIYVRDTVNRFVLANETVAQRMGAAGPADLIGKTDADFYPPEQAALFSTADREVLAGHAWINFEEDFVHLDGKRRIILSTKVPLKDAHGVVTAMVGVGRDITERKQAEEALKQQAEELRAQNDTLSRFNRVAVGRELRMMELKRQVNELCARLGEKPCYKIVENEPTQQPSKEEPT